MKIRTEFKEGYNSIVEYENSDMLMDYGVLKMHPGTVYKDDKKFEKVFLLMSGRIRISWEKQSIEVSRDSFLDDDFWALNVCEDVEVTVEGLAEDSEIAVFKTPNDVKFESVVRAKDNSVIETRGEGSMNGAGTRIVKTLMDKKLAPLSNFMFGEDVHYPGKWAGFPSHSHNQPEVYFYKFYPENGFGLVKLGDEGVLVEHNDTITIDPDLVHPQVAAPGYAMYFLWIIRHLDGNPYLAPTFEEEHLWVEKPGAKYWPEI
jgi:5-deoxy-glucuronate isomerase